MEKQTPKNIIGIICDDYKLRTFKRKLKSKGFTFTTVQMKSSMTLIKVDGTPSQQPEVQKICEAIERHFQSLKN